MQNFGKFSQVNGRKSSLKNDWLIFRKGVRGATCSCSENFFQALFSQTLISARRTHLQLKNDLVDFGQIWPDARTIYSQQYHVGELDNSKKSFLESHFRAATPHVFSAVFKMS